METAPRSVIDQLIERLDRQEQAIRLLAQTIEDGSWNGLPLEIDRILYPNKQEGVE